LVAIASQHKSFELERNVRAKEAEFGPSSLKVKEGLREREPTNVFTQENPTRIELDSDWPLRKWGRNIHLGKDSASSFATLIVPPDMPENT
jgi:hypothetical protein